MNHLNLEILSLNEIQACFDELAKFTDESIISAELAAIYLGVSKKTLARYRQKKEGPPFYQYPSAGSKVRNQKVHYKIKDLKEWREKFRVHSTIEAAKLRGLTFACVNDIEREEPFWIKNNVVYQHAVLLSKDTFIYYLNNDFQIEWIKWHDLFSRKYELSTYLDVFRRNYIEFLMGLINLAKVRK